VCVFVFVCVFICVCVFVFVCVCCVCVYVSVAQVIQYTVRMLRILSCVTWPAVSYFYTLSHKRHDFRKNVVEYEMCVLIFSTNLSETFLILSRIQYDIIINLQRSPLKCPLFLSDFDES
jgi:hypothetical protein